MDVLDPYGPAVDRGDLDDPARDGLENAGAGERIGGE